MKRRIHKKSIFTSSIIVFLSISTLIFLFGTFIVIKERNILTKQYERAVETQITNYYTQLEKELQNIKTQQDTLVYDNDFTYLLNKDFFDYKVSRAINSIGTKLLIIKESCTYLEKVQVYYPLLENSITAGDQRIKYTDEDNQAIQMMMEQRTNAFIEYYDEKLYIITAPRTYGDMRKNYYAIISCISIEELFKDIQKFELDKEATSMLTLNNNLICKTENGKELLFKKALEEEGGQLKEGISYTTYKGEKYIVASYYSEILQSKYAQAIPVKAIFSEVEQLKDLYNLFSIVTIVAILIFVWYIFASIKKPLNVLMDAFQELENENFDITLKHAATYEFSVVFNSFNRMVKKLRSLINDVYLQKILIQKAELRQLQAQINPHFLYNSFFILKNRIASGNQEEAQQFCQMLGVYFSYITKNYKDYTTLKEEVEHAKIYADIQAVRFSNRLQVSFAPLPLECNEIRIPKLVLQPIIENAFKYGLESIEFDGLLRVYFEKEDAYLHIIVEDNGESFADDQDKIRELNHLFENYEEIKEPSGMFNINRRIKILFGEQCGIKVNRSEELGGLKVTVSLSAEGVV